MMLVNHTNTEIKKCSESCESETGENICEICYGNSKCDKYKCGECENSICVECAESWSKMVSDDKDNSYSVKCPFCRKREVYKYDDLTIDEYKVFYTNLRQRLANLKKPLWEQQKYCENYCDDLQYIRYWASRMTDDSKLKTDKKFYENIDKDIKKIIDNKYDVIDGSKLHRDYYKAIEEIDELKDNKRLYDSCKAYNETIKNKLLKQQYELDKQTEMMRNIVRQNEMLLHQNKELFSKVNDVYNIVSNKNEIRKPQQVIKTIANNFKEIVADTQRNNLSINIVLDTIN